MIISTILILSYYSIYFSKAETSSVDVVSQQILDSLGNKDVFDSLTPDQLIDDWSRYL